MNDYDFSIQDLCKAENIWKNFNKKIFKPIFKKIINCKVLLDEREN